jgi:hypothetical protein
LGYLEGRSLETHEAFDELDFTEVLSGVADAEEAQDVGTAEDVVAGVDVFKER